MSRKACANSTIRAENSSLSFLPGAFFPKIASACAFAFLGLLRNAYPAFEPPSSGQSSFSELPLQAGQRFPTER
jgi:hypothetical protein